MAKSSEKWSNNIAYQNNRGKCLTCELACIRIGNADYKQIIFIYIVKGAFSNENSNGQ